MAKTHTYRAPWGRSVKIQTIGIITLFAFIIATHVYFGSHSESSPHPAITFLFIAPIILILPLISLFMVRNYELNDLTLFVQRSFWKTKVDLKNINSIDIVPYVMSGSFRFGNSGFFAISGSFQNKRLGLYQAFVTDTKRTVVLKSYKKTVVISPDNPEKFVDDVKSIISTLRNEGSDK